MNSFEISDEKPRLVNMTDMRPGEFGVIEVTALGDYLGELVFRTTPTTNKVVSLKDGDTWALPCDTNKVRILPAGTKITITVGE